MTTKLASMRLWAHIPQNPISKLIDARINSWPVLHATRWWSKRYNASQVVVWIHTIRIIEAHQWAAAITATRIVAFQTASTQLSWSDLYALQTIHAIATAIGHSIDLDFQFDVTVRCCWESNGKLCFVIHRRMTESLTSFSFSPTGHLQWYIIEILISQLRRQWQTDRSHEVIESSWMPQTQ